MKRIIYWATGLFLSFWVHAQTSHLVTTLNPTGPGSLGYYIDNSQDGDTIRFDPALLANGSDTLHFATLLTPLHGLVIEGLMNNGDTLYLSGNGQMRLFNMNFPTNSTARFVLKDLVLIDGFTYLATATGSELTYGGGIFAAGCEYLGLENCVMRNCVGTGYARGGALYAFEVDSVRIVNCLFQNNHTDTLGESGGAVYCPFSKTRVINSRFTGNYTGNRGGALNVGMNGLWIKNCQFINNHTVNNFPTSSSYGGAVAYWGSGIVEVEDCAFIDNSGIGPGGALYAGTDTTLTASNSYFQNNSATEEGDAIFASYNASTITNCTFVDNLCDIPTKGALQCNGFTNINRCTFINNQAGGGSSIAMFKGSITRSTITADAGTSYLLFRPNNSDIVSVGHCVFSHTSATATVTTYGNWINGGFNAFSNNPTWSQFNDQTLVDTLSLGLLPLGMYGGFTPTRPPGLGSVLLNAGSPINFSAAQNGLIFGIRDIGAAEYRYFDTTYASSCNPVSWWGNTYSQPGVYSDTAYNANTLDSVGILVLQPLQAQLTNQGGVLTASNQPPTATYQWVYCDSNYAPVPNATASTFLPAVNGSYALVSTYGSCTDTSGCVSYNEVGLTEPLQSKRFIAFYPNPTSGAIHFQAIQGLWPEAVEVMDLNGRQLAELAIHQAEVQLPQLASGVYFLKWKMPDGTVQVDRILFGD